MIVIKRVDIVKCPVSVAVVLAGPDQRAKSVKYYPAVNMARAPNH